MATNFVQEGDTLALTNAGSATIRSGSAFKVGPKVIGVALVDIPAGFAGAVAVEGVYRLPKVSADAIAQGDDLYLMADGTVTKTATNNTPAGYAVEAAPAGATTVAVKINYC